jgi:hypothetical protein
MQVAVAPLPPESVAVPGFAARLRLWPNTASVKSKFPTNYSGKNPMGNQIVTEADRKATPRPATLPGFTLPTGGRGQRVSLERGVATRSKKNPGKRSKKGG